MIRNQRIKLDLPGIWWVQLVAGILGLAVLLGVNSPASASDQVADPIADAVREALDGWARYATTGDLLALGSSFVRGGPQWRQFEAESAIGRPSLSGAPLHFDLHDIRLRSRDTTEATVWVEVEARRDGFVRETFGWDFDVIKEDGQWRVWTVISAVEPPESAQLRALDATTTTSTTTTPASTAAMSDPASEEPVAAAAAGSVRGTRIPVLSAWVVVVTVVGVAVAGYMAPRIDRRGEG